MAMLRTTSGRLLLSTVSPSSGCLSYTALHFSDLMLTWKMFKEINSTNKKGKSNRLKMTGYI